MFDRHRNLRSWLARCYVAEGSGNPQERDVTISVNELLAIGYCLLVIAFGDYRRDSA